MRLTFLLILALSACSDGRPADPDETMPIVAAAPQSRPTDVSGTWAAVREICDPDGDAKPHDRIAPSTLTLTQDGRYRRVEDGKEVRGAYRLVISGSRLSVVLDHAAKLAHYEYRNGELVNWSEGQTIRPCAPVLERRTGVSQ